jgi:hypothetical protein
MSILQAYLSSSEEGLFGAFLEGLATFIAGKTLGGKKTPGSGIDLDFEKDGVVYLVSIKSSLNWGNSSQYAALKSQFKKAVQILKQSRSIKAVQPVLASCYGKRRAVNNGEYLRICGQEFWYFISGNKNLYTDIIEPLGHQAKERNQEYQDVFDATLTKLAREFEQQFFTNNRINWKKLVQFNSGNMQ